MLSSGERGSGALNVPVVFGVRLWRCQKFLKRHRVIDRSYAVNEVSLTLARTGMLKGACTRASGRSVSAVATAVRARPGPHRKRMPSDSRSVRGSSVQVRVPDEMQKA